MAGSDGTGSWQEAGGSGWEEITPIKPSETTSDYLYMILFRKYSNSKDNNNTAFYKFGGSYQVGVASPVIMYSGTATSIIMVDNNPYLTKFNSDDTVLQYKPNLDSTVYAKITDASLIDKMWRMKL